MKYFFSSMNLSNRIITGLILGILVGIFFGESSLSIKWIGDVWIRLMQMTVLPYVVVSLIGGVGSLDAKLAKSLAIRGGLLLLIFWIISAVIIFAMPFAFPQWQDASFYSSAITHDIKPFNPIKIYVPENPFFAMANSIIPSVVLFCIAVGVALISHKDKAQLVDILKVFTDVLAKVMGFMVQLTPIGVFSIVAVSAGTMTIQQLTHLQVYFVVYIVASLYLTFVVLPLLISMLTHFKYRDVIVYSRSALLTGFIAQNVFIILPMLIESSKEIFKQYQLDSEKNHHVIDVIIPVTFNFPNTGRLLALLFIPFAAWMSGSELELSQYPEFIATGIFSLFAKAQIALPFLLDLFQIPHDMFNFYIPSSIINGKFDTMVSVMNLFAFSLIITAGLTGQLHFSRKKVVRNTLLMISLLILIVFLTRTLLFTITDSSYTKHDLVMNMSMPKNIPNVQKAVYENHRIDIDEPYYPALLDNNLLEHIKQRGVLRVGYRQDRLPFSFRNSDNQLVGLDIEIVTYLAHDLGVDLVFYPMALNTFREQLNQGEIDLMTGIGYNTPNLVKLEVSLPYIDGHLGVVTKDFRRHDFMTVEAIREMEKLTLAILASPRVVEYITRRLQVLLPETELKMIPIANYEDFFSLADDQVDGLIELVEIGSALTLLHPEYSSILPRPSMTQFPLSYGVAKGEKDFALFLSHWLAAKKANAVIYHAKEYWISGKGAEKKEPRWSIMHNVLGW
jgi:Na+/H+-dicarboxylate symporter/ABC-type amino acid transport substrate-binding protein